MLWKRSADAKARRAKRKKKGGGAKKPRDPNKGGIPALYNMLWPAVPFSDGADGAGSKEIGGMLLLCR